MDRRKVFAMSTLLILSMVQTRAGLLQDALGVLKDKLTGLVTALQGKEEEWHENDEIKALKKFKTLDQKVSYIVEDDIRIKHGNWYFKEINDHLILPKLLSSLSFAKWLEFFKSFEPKGQKKLAQLMAQKSLLTPQQAQYYKTIAEGKELNDQGKKTLEATFKKIVSDEDLKKQLKEILKSLEGQDVVVLSIATGNNASPAHFNQEYIQKQQYPDWLKNAASKYTGKKFLILFMDQFFSREHEEDYDKGLPVGLPDRDDWTETKTENEFRVYKKDNLTVVVIPFLIGVKEKVRRMIGQDTVVRNVTEKNGSDKDPLVTSITTYCKKHLFRNKLVIITAWEGLSSIFIKHMTTPWQKALKQQRAALVGPGGSGHVIQDIIFNEKGVGKIELKKH